MKNKLPIAAVVGAVTGVVAGILTAPKSGNETRKDVKKNVVALKKKTTLTVNTLADKAKSVVSDLRSNLDKKK